MAYGCNDPLRFARQAEAEAIMNGYMMPGTGLNGPYSIFSNPYVGYVPKYNNAIPYGAPTGVMAPQGMVTPQGATTNVMSAPQGMATGDTFTKTTAADGADDGKISFGKKMLCFAKGAVSPITGMFSSVGNFVKGAIGIAAGAGLIAITGGAAAPIMVAAGIGLGGFQIAKGAVGAATAKTDAEAEQAWESMGSGTVAVAGSVAGAKAALKASGANTSGMSTLEATKECFTHGFSKANLTKAWTTAKTNTTNFFKGNGKAAAGKGNANAGNEAKVTEDTNKRVEPAKKNELGETPEEIIESGQKRIRDGESSNKVQKEATRNLKHDDKKVVKKKLQEERNKVLEEATNARKKASIDGAEIRQSVGESNNLKQQANTATTETDVANIEKQITENQIHREENLVEMREKFLEENKKLGQGSEEFGGLTKKQRQAMRRAENQNTKARINENKALEIAQENQANTAEAEAVKAANQNKWLDGQTEESIAQLEANANKTHANATARIEKKLLNDKRTQAKMEKLKYASKEKLEKIFNNPANKFEEAAAYQLLLQA